MFWRKRDEEDEWDSSWSESDWGDEDEQRPRGRRRWLFLVTVALLVGLSARLWWNKGEDGPPAVATVTSSLTAASAPSHGPATVADDTAPTTDEQPIATPQTVSGALYDPDALAVQLLEMINAARAEAGLPPVGWDETAARAARAHTADMVARNYFSHWNPEGLGPDHRYALASGQHSARENLHALASAFSDGRPVPIDDWPAAIHNAHAGLMNSPGHRAAILDPAQTHVGIGMAYDSAAGQFRLAEVFTGQHTALSATPPPQAAPGESLRIAGAFGSLVVGNPLLNLAYEPFPTPLSPRQLADSGTYRSAAESVTTRAVGLTFDETFSLPVDAPPGLYHVRLFADLASGQAMVVDLVVEVRGDS